MGTTTSSLFTGSSQFSTDLQNVITREVNIASLPITLLKQDLTGLQSQSTDLTGIDAKFAALQTAVANIDQAMNGSSFEADVSNTAVASATPSSGAMEGNYSIEVDDIGAYASSMTSSAWVATTNPTGQEHTYQLVVGTTTYNITPSDNSASSVAAAINAAAGGQVQATVVNVASSASPDTRIVLRSTTLGDTKLDIQDGGVSLQTSQTTGRPAQYIVNGSGKTVTSNSRAVAIAPGLTVNLLSSARGSPVDITVTRSTSALSTALSGFADAYNAVVSALQAERGQSTGGLAGQSLVYEMTNALSGLATYSSTGSSISGLRDLGFELLDNGTLTFDSFALMGTDIGNSTGVDSFLGTAASGGFLKSATDALIGLEDPTTGLIKTAETGVQNQITSVNRQISTKQDQVDRLQQNLTAQMSAADAALSVMEQQYSYLSGMFQAEQVANQQYAGA